MHIGSDVKAVIMVVPHCKNETNKNMEGLGKRTFFF